MSIFCPYCGNKNLDWARFCRSCGSSLASVHSGPFAQRRVTQPTPIEYAGFWKRFAAFIIDYILIYIANFVISVMIGLVVTVGAASDTGIGVVHSVILFSFWLVAPWLYWALMESSSHQATLGKKALKIKVTDYSGERLTFARATGRHWAKIASFATIYIGFIMAGFTTKKQGLHDMISESLVVTTKEDEIISNHSKIGLK